MSWSLVSIVAHICMLGLIQAGCGEPGGRATSSTTYRTTRTASRRFATRAHTHEHIHAQRRTPHMSRRARPAGSHRAHGVVVEGVRLCCSRKSRASSIRHRQRRVVGKAGPTSCSPVLSWPRPLPALLLPGCRLCVSLWLAGGVSLCGCPGGCACRTLQPNRLFAPRALLNNMQGGSLAEIRAPRGDLPAHSRSEGIDSGRCAKIPVHHRQKSPIITGKRALCSHTNKIC